MKDKITPHSFKRTKSMPWPWCQRCGLVLLHNAATEWCRQRGCDYDEHPDYRAAMRRLTAPAEPAP